jgi:transposase
MGEFKHYPKIVYINNAACYISASVIKSKTGKPEFQFLISFNNPSKSKECYKKRWQIETMFKALKSSGFNIEKTHLQQIERIEKLVALVFIAFVWCYKVGIYIDQNEIKVKIKKHGYRAKSLFKHGLDYISNILLNPQKRSKIDVFKFLSCS